MTQCVFSRHAMVRAKQRGITSAQIDAIIRYADMECSRGGGCTSIWISRRELWRFGSATPEGISTDRLQGVTVVQGGDEACVTVFRNRKSKTYRRSAGGRR
jgi:hypothetical protein